jgi:hypothetical protein
VAGATGRMRGPDEVAGRTRSAFGHRHARQPGLTCRRRGRELDRRAWVHHDAFVRTTLTLEPDVVRLLEEEAARQRKPFKQVVNEAIRRGLAPTARARSRRVYRVRPHETQLRPGIDTVALNALADELEDEAIIARTARSR